MTLEPISVLSVTYALEGRASLERYFASIAAQTLPAAEIVLVLDGDIGSELEAVITGWMDKLPIVLLSQPKAGLAAGLNLGLRHCRHAIVMRCDTDDASLPERFERQARALIETRSSVVSGPIRETWADGKTRYRSVPPGSVGPARISSFFRSPVNHNNCCFRKSEIEAAGGYPSGRMEDFRLWSKLLASGGRIYNLTEVLLDADARALNARRGGSDYARAELALFAVNSRRMIPLGAVLAFAALVVRVAMRTEMLSPTRAWLYRHVLRRENGAGAS